MGIVRFITFLYRFDILSHDCRLSQLVSPDETEIYLVGIIDVLQQYDRKKQFERFAKVYLLQKDGVCKDNNT